jgi:hypothetical protein
MNSCNDALTRHRHREKLCVFGMHADVVWTQRLTDHRDRFLFLFVSLSLGERTFGSGFNPGVAGQQGPDGSR